MKAIPTYIPRSLQTYLEQFQNDPETAIEKLEVHLKKRGPDAVGHYLLSWFHHHLGDHDEAVRNAWKAKIYAPGSPMMERLHYFMSHPGHFNAWKPEESAIEIPSMRQTERRNHSISDLDSLINKLSSLESKKIEFSTEMEEGPDLSEESTRVEDIATETLARIHEKQGRFDTAIEVYQRLMKIQPHKKEQYEKQVERLRQQQKQ